MTRATFNLHRKGTMEELVDATTTYSTYKLCIALDRLFHNVTLEVRELEDDIECVISGPHRKVLNLLARNGYKGIFLINCETKAERILTQTSINMCNVHDIDVMQEEG